MEEISNKELDAFERRRSRVGSHTDRFEVPGGEVVFNSEKRLRKDVYRYTSKIQYDFLQYIRVVMKWARSNTGMDKRRIELLLYLYPIGLFNNVQFRHMCRTVEIPETKVLQVLQKDGWIKQWRPSKGRFGAQGAELFALSDKATRLCFRMHKMCIGEEEIPMSYYNAMTKKKYKIDKFYLNIAQELNEKVRAKKKKAAEE